MGSGHLMTGQEIYENFTNAPGPDSLLEAQQHLALVEAVYTDRENQIKALAASMEEGWTGEAAGAAQRGAGPLAVAHGGAAQEMATAKDLLHAQANSFYDARSSVVPVPPAPEKPSTFRNIITMGGAQSDYEHGLSKTNQAAQANVAAMDSWTSASNYNGTMMPTEYGQIDPRAMNVSMVESKTPPLVSPFGGEGGMPDGGRHMTGGGNPETHHREPNPTGTNAGDHNSIGRNPGRLPGAGSGDGTTPGGYTPPVTGPGSPGWQGGPGSPVWQPSGGQAGQQSAGYLNSELDGLGSGGMGSGAGGRSAVPGSGNGGNGSAPDRLPGGRGTGAAAPGTANEPIGRGSTGVGAKGPGARPGMPGMGVGQKGQGAEDEEHQRKYVVEDDVHFQLTDEDGEKVVDPRTGMPLTPPVIGN